MKQTKVFTMLFACLLFGISFATVSAQSASSQGSIPEPGSRDAAKQNYLATKNVAGQNTQTKAVPQGKIIASGKTNVQVRPQPATSAPAADRRQQLLDLKAAAAAKGLPTAKYDLELQKLNN